jgi:hypothetical protein
MQINNGLISLWVDGNNTHDLYDDLLSTEMVISDPILGKIWIDVIQGDFLHIFREKICNIKPEHLKTYRIDTFHNLSLRNGEKYDAVTYYFLDNNNILRTACELLLIRTGYCVYVRNKGGSNFLITDLSTVLSNIEINEEMLFNNYPKKNCYYNPNRFTQKTRSLLYEYYKNIFENTIRCAERVGLEHFFCPHVFPVLECISMASNQLLGLLYGDIEATDGDKSQLLHFDQRDIHFWTLPINRSHLWNNPGNAGVHVYLNPTNDLFLTPNFWDGLKPESSNAIFHDEYEYLLNNIEYFGGWLGIQPDQEDQDFILFVFSNSHKDLYTKAKNLVNDAGYCTFSACDAKNEKAWSPLGDTTMFRF